jgi:hypothetical protein
MKRLLKGLQDEIASQTPVGEMIQPNGENINTRVLVPSIHLGYNIAIQLN